MGGNFRYQGKKIMAPMNADNADWKNARIWNNKSVIGG